MGERKGNGLTLEITDGITEHANRVALKGVFSAFGDVLACWVPPIDRRGVDHASVRFAVAQSAESAKAACDAGQVFFQGLPLKVKWRAGGGPRVGNSDIGGSVGGNSPTRPPREALRDSDGRQDNRLREKQREENVSSAQEWQRSRDGREREGRDRRRRGNELADRSRSRKRRRSRSRRREPEPRLEDVRPEADPYNALDAMPALPAPTQFSMPPEMMQAMRPPMSAGGPMYPGAGTPIPGMPQGMPQGMQAMPEPVPQMQMPTAEELEAAERRKKEIQAKRAATMKRGPGVAALVQGALKNAQTATVKSRKEDEKDDVQNLDKDEDDERAQQEKKKKEEPKKTKQQIEEERVKKELEEQQERERLEREALEREREKARKAAEEKAREEERLVAEAANREKRVREGVEAAKKNQALREIQMAKGGQVVMGPENLYGDMPDAGMEPEDLANESRRKEEARRAAKNFNLPPEDNTKVVFLDIDGVLRPARAGGFDIQSDGKEASHPDTSDFFPSAMKALRHIIERTGSIIVLSSEWRRNEALRDAIDEVLEANRIRPTYGWTGVDIDEIRSNDPVRSFADRRAREVSAWLRQNEASVKGWVVLDDINLAIADEDKKPDTKSMGPKLVQTWPLCGLTMGNAKTAVRILNGEMIHKVLVERPKAPGGINVGAAAGASGNATPVTAAARPGH